MEWDFVRNWVSSDKIVLHVFNSFTHIYMTLVVSKGFFSLHRCNSVISNAQINHLVCSWSDSLLTQIRWKQIACRKIAFIASKLWWRACGTIRTSFTIKIITSSSGISDTHHYMVYWDHRDCRLNRWTKSRRFLRISYFISFFFLLVDKINETQACNKILYNTLNIYEIHLR